MTSDATVKIVTQLAEVNGPAWDACANPDPARSNPFVSHAFLNALEDAGTVGPKTGWMPRHLVLDDGQGGIGAGLLLPHMRFQRRSRYERF